MTSEKPLILVTNDDSVHAPGIAQLVKIAANFGDVVVVAPDKPQSGMGHAVTLNSFLRLQSVRIFGEIEAHACSGTPVDCVKIAVDKVLKRKPDLCLSGINHGSNSSINILYSGTMSAAVEAAIENIPSIGFSLCDFKYDADFHAAEDHIAMIIRNMLNSGLPAASLLNVNIPAIPKDQIKGIKVCRQAVAKWEEEYEQRHDPHGGSYYWLSGKFVNYDHGSDTDEWALANGYLSLVPVQFDMTAHHVIPFVNQNWQLK